MSKVSLEHLAGIGGYFGSSLVDSHSGMLIGANGGGPIDLEIAAAGNTQVVRAIRKTLKSLGLTSEIEDILISLSDAYHIMRPLQMNDAVFLYLALSRKEANLGLARHELKNFEHGLIV